MFKHVKLGTKLLMGFASVSFITLILGTVGYYGAMNGESSVMQVGGNLLPSVNNLQIINEAQTAIDGNENALLSRDIDLKERQEKYADFEAIWKRADEAWKKYESLPQSDEEARIWKEFVPAWEKWKKDDEAFVALSREYDKTVEAQITGKTLYASMSQQTLVTNAVSLDKSEQILKQLIKIYVAKADKDAAVNKQDLLKVYALVTINQAQSVIDGAENGLLDRNGELQMRETQYQRIADAWGRIDTTVKLYESMEKDANEAALWSEFLTAWSAWKKDHETFISVSKQYDTTVNDFLLSNALYKKMSQQSLVTNAATYAVAEKMLNTILEMNTTGAEQEVNASETNAKFLKAFTLISCIAGVVLAMTMGFLIARGITRTLTRISEGISEGADQVATASGQVSGASQSMAEGASEQAASIEETSSSMEEMASMTKRNSENARNADSLMREANHVVTTANSSMQMLTQSMSEISRASEETSKIIKTIDEIAFQTNLLALNAAVEAARAGEAGAGFAVVADEVRNLAMRAATAAKDTAQLIEGTVKKVNTGSELVDSTNEAFSKVAQSSTRVGTLIAEIADASREQTTGIEQVNTAILEMDKVVQQNAANAEESAASAEEMNAQAEQLKEYVDELALLINGQKNGNGQMGGIKHLSHHPLKTIAAKSKGAKAVKKNLVAHSPAHEIRPEHVIPLDEDDSFKNF